MFAITPNLDIFAHENIKCSIKFIDTANTTNKLRHDNKKLDVELTLNTKIDEQTEDKVKRNNH